jgi:hypothetical protein
LQWDVDPVTEPVREVSPVDKAWADLATQLTPANSLARVDAATARTVTTVTIIGVLLTGLGTLTVTQLSQSGPSRGIAIAAVITATFAVASALMAQVLTITRRVNSANLIEVKAWYRRQFSIRAYPTQAATVFLLLAAVLASATAITSLLASHLAAPVISITQSLGPASTAASASGERATIGVDVTFTGLASAQVATVTITPLGTDRLLGSAAATPGPTGTATATLTVSDLTVGQPIAIIATADHQQCRAVLDPARSQPALACHAIA